jgi:hypothetical protein
MASIGTITPWLVTWYDGWKIGTLERGGVKEKDGEGRGVHFPLMSFGRREGESEN